MALADGPGWAHLCIDVQRMFAEETPWQAPWLKRVLPAIEELAGRMAERTVFTRFQPPRGGDDVPGAWRTYYDRWPEMVGERLDPSMRELVPALSRFVPPGRVFDKPIYSPWLSGELHRFLRKDAVERVIISGGESDICVLATVLGAIDLGYHVVLPLDALFGSADETHDAVLDIYRSRFQTQLTITSVAELLG